MSGRSNGEGILARKPLRGTEGAEKKGKVEHNLRGK